MNCGRVSNQLSAFIDRELAGIEMLQIRRHLTECDRCRSEHESLGRMKMMLGRLRSLEPPPPFVGETVQRFGASGAWTAGAAPWGRRAPRYLLVATRLFPARETAGAPLQGIRPGSLSAPVIRRVLLGLIPLQSLARALATAALAAALIFTTVVLLRPRHADTLVASTPAFVLQGQDQDSLNPPHYFDEAPSAFIPHDVWRGRLSDGQTSLPWVPVSLQGETSWTFR
jgi:anti-sigma factor RsiW